MARNSDWINAGRAEVDAKQSVAEAAGQAMKGTVPIAAFAVPAE